MGKELEKRLRSVLVFGAPGSGKGTLAKALSQAGGHLHLSSGDLFRGLSPDSLEGKLYYEYAHKGKLIPDDATVEIWKHYVQGLIATNKYLPDNQILILDGIPRTVKQAQMMDDLIKVEKIIYLDVENPEILVQRLHRRALIEKRVDDADEEILRKRMQVYKEETLKTLSFYPKELVVHFDASKRPIEVLRDVLVKLCDLFK